MSQARIVRRPAKLVFHEDFVIEPATCSDVYPGQLSPPMSAKSYKVFSSLLV